MKLASASQFSMDAGFVIMQFRAIELMRLNYTCAFNINILCLYYCTLLFVPTFKCVLYCMSNNYLCSY